MASFKTKLETIIEEHFDTMHNEINEEMKVSIRNDNWYMERDIEEIEAKLVTVFFDNILWHPCQPDGSPYSLAWIRPDIIEKGLAVPVGASYYGSSTPLPYRWVTDETFEVCYCGIWAEAQSIDWDFSDAVPEEMQKFSSAGEVAAVRADGCKSK